MRFHNTQSGLNLKGLSVRGLWSVLLGSSSIAVAADRPTVPQQPDPVPMTSREKSDACVPEFAMPNSSNSYQDLLNEATQPSESSSPLSSSPSNVVPPSPDQSFNFSGNVQSGQLMASRFVPNMVGDAGSLGGPVQTTVTSPVTATGTTTIGNFLTAFTPNPNPASPSPWNPTVNGPTNFVVTGVTPNGGGVINGLQFTTQASQASLFGPGGIDVVALVNNPAAYLSVPGNLAKLQNIPVQDSSQVNSLVQNSIVASNNLPAGGNLVYTNGNVGINNNGTAGVGVWNYQYNYIPIFVPSTIPSQVASLIPAGGSVGAAPSINLGRQKLAENASPIPRDRVYVNYNYFNNTPLYPGGVNVNRVTPGFEKTFFNGRTSFEIRAPFATTLDSTVNLNGITNTNNSEFGNLTMYFKGLLYTDPTWAFSAGLGVVVPTADNFVVKSGNTTLTTVKNQSTHLLPFFAGTYTPTNRFFAQAMMQIDVDTNGNNVAVSQFNGTTFTGNQTSIGRGYDYTYMYLDFNCGYWIYQNPGSGRFITGIAPIAEVHVNQTVGSANTVGGNVNGVNWNFQPSGAFTQVNGMVGMTAIVADHSTVTAAYVTPMSGDRGFDGEFRLYFNWFFGRSLPTNRLLRTTAF